MADASAKSGLKMIKGHAAKKACFYCTVKVNNYILLYDIIQILHYFLIFRVNGVTRITKC